MGFAAKLISPVWVTIEQVNVAATVMDEDAREPVKQAARSSVVRIKAQVSYSRTQGTNFYRGGHGGPSDEASGHLVFLRKHITAQSLTFRRGDRITSIGGVTVEHYFDERENAAHNRGSSELEVWNFIDNDPTKK